MSVARKMGLRPNGRGRYAFVCALCKHSASGHTYDGHGDYKIGPYRCDCGCEIPQDGPGFWLSERDWNVWLAAFPLVLSVKQLGEILQREARRA